MGGQRYWKDGRDVYDFIMGLMDYPETDKPSRVHAGASVQLRGRRRRRHDVPVRGQRRRDQRQLHRAHAASDGIVQPSRNDVLKGYNSVITFSKCHAGRAGREADRSNRRRLRRRRATSWPEKYSVPRGYDERLDHFVNFFTSIREKKPVYENATFGFRAAAPALLCNDSLR